MSGLLTSLASILPTAGGGGGGIARVDSLIYSPDTGGGGTTGAINSTGANLIVIAIAAYSHNDTPTDSKSNTYTGLTQQGSGTGFLRLYYCVAPTVGSGHTFSTTSDYCTISAIAFSGASASPLGSQNGGTGSLQPGSITPGANGSVVITAIGSSDGSSTTIPSLAGGFTSYGVSCFGDHAMLGLAWYVQPTAAAINPTWTAVNTSSNRCAIVNFLAA